jgi:hypothetical protein
LRDFGFEEVRAASPNPSEQRARKIEFRQQSQRATQRPVPCRKNISLPFGLPAAHSYAVHSTKGRIAIVTDAEPDAMDALVSQGVRRGAYGQAVWF